MEKSKICPICGKKNPTNLFECFNCDADLTSVPIVDESLLTLNQSDKYENLEQKNAPDTSPRSSGYILVCPKCKHRNPANFSTCEICKRELEDVDPEEYSEDASIELSFENYSTHKKNIYKISPNETLTIGLEAFLAEEMTDCDYVSRRHCEINYIGGNLYIKDISGKDFEGNGTYINGRRLIRHKNECLENETVLGLGSPIVNEPFAAFFKISYKI